MFASYANKMPFICGTSLLLNNILKGEKYTNFNFSYIPHIYYI